MQLILKPISGENENNTVVEQIDEIIDELDRRVEGQPRVDLPLVDRPEEIPNREEMQQYLEGQIPENVINNFNNMRPEEIIGSINTGFGSLIERYKLRTWEPSYDVKYENFMNTVDADIKNKVKKVWTYLIEKEIKLCKILIIELPAILHPLLLKMLEGFVGNLIEKRTEQDHLDIISIYVSKNKKNRAGPYLQQLVQYSIVHPRKYTIKFKNSLLNILEQVPELLEYFVHMITNMNILFDESN